MSLGNLTFKGGIHIPEYKELSNKTPLVEYRDPQTVVIPLHQNTGAPCQSLVKVGDRVLEGQKIGEAKAMISAPVHASVSGVVKSILDITTLAGRQAQAIVIENDGQHEKAYTKPKQSYETMSPEALIQVIKDGGIVGMGGAAFPTHIKLNPPKDKTIEYLIINGAECEPYLTSDDILMQKMPERVVTGVKICMRILGVHKAFIAIEDNKPEAIKQMQEAVSGDGIEVASVKTKYPQGDEKRLIDAVVGRVVPSGGLPMDVGCVVVNAATAAAIADCVTEGKPLYERIVTVTGSAIAEPKRYICPIGTSIADLAEASGGYKEPVGKIISGGPMMGLAEYDVTSPIEKASNGVIFMSETEAQPPEAGPCLKCGKCIDVCPVNLTPLFLQLYSLNDLWDEAQKNHILDCIECGSCSYTCPAKRPLVEAIRLGKREVRNAAMKVGGR